MTINLGLVMGITVGQMRETIGKYFRYCGLFHYFSPTPAIVNVRALLKTVSSASKLSEPELLQILMYFVNSPMTSGSATEQVFNDILNLIRPLNTQDPKILVLSHLIKENLLQEPFIEPIITLLTRLANNQIFQSPHFISAIAVLCKSGLLTSDNVSKVADSSSLCRCIALLQREPGLLTQTALERWDKVTELEKKIESIRVDLLITDSNRAFPKNVLTKALVLPEEQYQAFLSSEELHFKSVQDLTYFLNNHTIKTSTHALRAGCGR